MTRLEGSGYAPGRRHQADLVKRSIGNFYRRLEVCGPKPTMNVEGASMAHQGVNQRRKLEEMNLEQVADEMALGPTSYNHHAAQAEFARRQAVWQRDAAKRLNSRPATCFG